MESSILRALSDPLSYRIMAHFARTALRHPIVMSQENLRLFSQFVLGKKEKPGEGIRFEQHSHSHYSDGPELSDIIDFLFNEGISIWSLTDHGNSNAFDDLKNGKYRLSRRYELETCPDGRYLSINADGRQIVLLKSMEKLTDVGEIGLHGYSGAIPNGKISLIEAIRTCIGQGGYVIINHPFILSGIGVHGVRFIEDAVKAGAIAIEKNGLNIGPFIYDPVMVEVIAKKLEIPIVPSEDSHRLETYGISGVVFDKESYRRELKAHGGNHADTIQSRFRNRNFSTYFNYANPLIVISMVRDHIQNL